MESARARDNFISSTWVVWSLGRGGSVHTCSSCGARMFVRYSSGLCPLCFNGLRDPAEAAGAVHVAAERALAGVLDDPAIEEPHTGS
jgi:hypothetical protein